MSIARPPLSPATHGVATLHDVMIEMRDGAAELLVASDLGGLVGMWL